MGRLDGKVAVITGAARGMGEAEARLFHAEGAQVVLADVLDDLGASVARDLGTGARYVHLDVAEEGDWAAVLAEATEAFGVPDVLVNNAGILRVGRILETDRALFEEVLAVDLIGPFLGMRTVGAAMADAGRGSIVNVSSTGGLVGMSMIGAYVAAKWGLRGLTKTAAIELGPSGVRVNSLHPGGVATPMVEVSVAWDVEPPPPGTTDADPLVAAADERSAGQPIARMGRPIEIARLALFLASDESSYCTGQEFVADGGSVAGQDLAGAFGEEG